MVITNVMMVLLSDTAFKDDEYWCWVLVNIIVNVWMECSDGDVDKYNMKNVVSVTGRQWL